MSVKSGSLPPLLVSFGNKTWYELLGIILPSFVFFPCAFFKTTPVSWLHLGPHFSYLQPQPIQNPWQDTGAVGGPTIAGSRTLCPDRWIEYTYGNINIYVYDTSLHMYIVYGHVYVYSLHTIHTSNPNPTPFFESCFLLVENILPKSFPPPACWVSKPNAPCTPKAILTAIFTTCSGCPQAIVRGCNSHVTLW